MGWLAVLCLALVGQLEAAASLDQVHKRVSGSWNPLSELWAHRDELSPGLWTPARLLHGGREVRVCCGPTLRVAAASVPGGGGAWALVGLPGSGGDR